MNDRIVRLLEAYLRVREFGATFTASIPAASLASELLARINQIATQMQLAASQQSSGSRAEEEATASKALAREELFEALMRIIRTARSMRRTMPGLEDKFRSPGKLKDQELLTFARAVAAEARLLKDEFTMRGLPTTFLEDLNDDIGKFEEAMTRQIQSESKKVSATATLADFAAEGMATLRELDPIMRNLFEDDVATYAAWLSARHIERAPRSNRSDTSSQPQKEEDKSE